MIAYLATLILIRLAHLRIFRLILFEISVKHGFQLLMLSSSSLFSSFLRANYFSFSPFFSSIFSSVSNFLSFFPAPRDFKFFKDLIALFFYFFDFFFLGLGFSSLIPSASNWNFNAALMLKITKKTWKRNKPTKTKIFRVDFIGGQIAHAPFPAE